MWAFDTTLYQIYPLGMLGCPFDAPDLADSAGMEGQIERHRIRQLVDWTPYLERLGVGAILLNPVFSSDTHGYNTRDPHRVDCRLGTNEDFAGTDAPGCPAVKKTWKAAPQHEDSSRHDPHPVAEDTLALEGTLEIPPYGVIYLRAIG